MPSEEVLPPGALRDMVTALHHLWRGAGMPSTRSVSIEIRKRNDLPDTVSHEVIAMLLRGGGLVKWQKFECVVRQLADWSVGGTQTADTTVREFHHLWLRAFDEGQPTVGGAPSAARDTGAGRTTSGSAPIQVAEAADKESLPAESLIHNLPGRNARFCGREPSLRQLGALLTAAATNPVVIHGLGGVGKTHLALEYAHRHRGDYALIWWIPAGDESGLRRSVRDLADRLGLRIGRDLNHVVRVVVTRLESTAQRWLLIFDNLEDEVIVDHALPAAGGDVLITTRNPGFASWGEALSVPTFTRTESVQFLGRMSRNISSDEADRIAELLGDLPLALAQVADVQAVTGMSWTRYISLFDGHLRDLLRDHRSADHAGLTASLDLTFRRLAENSPGALMLLEVLAHLGPAPVALALLRNGRSGRLTPALARCLNDPRQLQRAVGELVRVGVVGLEEDQGWVTMHRLVRDHARQGWGATQEARGRENARAVLTAADPGHADDERTWGLHALITPHVRTTDLVCVPTVEARQLVLHQVRFLYLTGDYVGSARLAQEAMDEWTPLDVSGPAFLDESVVGLSRHQANALRALGEYERSRDVTQSTLDRLRGDHQFGRDHPVTLDVATSAGVDLRIAGEYQAALAMEQDTLERSIRSPHVSTLRSVRVRANLGVSRRLLGDYAAAYDHHRDVLAHLNTLVEVDDHLLHTTQLNLAWDLYGLGRFDEMLAQASQAWSNLDPGLRPGHVLPLLAGRTVAVALRCLGRPEAAEASRRSYENHLNSWGADHERSLAASISHVNSLRAQARFGEAWSLAVDVQDTYRRRFGWRHPVTAASSVVLAGTLRGLGRSREAQELDEPAFHDLTSILGSDHPYTVAAANGLASDRLATGSIAAARSLAAHTADRAAHRYGEHPITSACRANAAVVTAGVDGSWIELDVEPPPA